MGAKRKRARHVVPLQGAAGLGVGALEGVRDLEEEMFVGYGADELEADREAGGGEADRDGDGGDAG